MGSGLSGSDSYILAGSEGSARVGDPQTASFFDGLIETARSREDGVYGGLAHQEPVSGAHDLLEPEAGALQQEVLGAV